MRPSYKPPLQPSRSSRGSLNLRRRTPATSCRRRLQFAWPDRPPHATRILVQENNGRPRRLKCWKWTCARGFIDRRPRAQIEQSRPAQRPSQHRHHCRRISTTFRDVWCSDVPHVRRGLDRGNVLQDSVGKTDDTNNGTGNDAVPAVADSYATNENVDLMQLASFLVRSCWTHTDTTTKEGEHERRIAGDLLRNLELK